MQTEERYRIDSGTATAVNVVAIAAAEDVALRGYTAEKIGTAVEQGEYVVLYSRTLDAARKESAVLDDTFIRGLITEWLEVRGRVSFGPVSRAAESGAWTPERFRKELAPDVRQFLKNYLRELAKAYEPAELEQSRDELVEHYRKERKHYAARILEDAPDFLLTFSPRVGGIISVIGQSNAFSWSIEELLAG